MIPLRWGKGTQFAGGHNKKCHICAIGLIPTSTTADTETELEVADWSYDDDYNGTGAGNTRTEGDNVDDTLLKRVFHVKALVQNIIPVYPLPRPIRIDRGITTITNTNCRPVFYVS